MTEQDLLAQPPADYMNEAQQRFFRELLLAQRTELQARIEGEFLALREQETNSDPADMGSAEEQRQWQLRLLERKRSCWTRSTTPSNCWPAASTAGAVTPANRLVCNACYCAPPQPCVSKPKNVKSCANAIDGRFDRPTLMRNT